MKMKKMNLKKAYEALNYGMYRNDLPRKKKKAAKKRALLTCKNIFHNTFDEYGNLL